MNFRFQSSLFSSILVILSAASFSSALKAQDLNNLKPTITPSEVMPQPGTGVNSPTRILKPTLETQSQESSTPASTTCQEKTPEAAQPGVMEPTDSMMNSPESKPMLEN